MPDTPRPLSEILTLFADNTSRNISPQDLRDFVVSIMESTYFWDYTNNRLGIGTSSPAARLDVVEGTPASTGTSIARVMGGSAATPLASITEGLVAQVYPGAGWSDAGNPHTVFNGRMEVPSGANFFPWVFSSHLRNDSVNGEGVNYWGRIESTAGAPGWFTAGELSDVAAGSTAVTMVGHELALFKYNASSVFYGHDIIAKGDQNSNVGIRIRGEGGRGWTEGLVLANADTGITIQSTVTTGMVSEVPAVHRLLKESGETAPNGRLREVIDSNLYRWDISTSGEYAAVRTPVLVTLGASGGDTLIGSSDTIGSSPIIRAGRGDGTAKLGFYAATPVAKQTGVAVTAAAIHAALVNYGLIAA